MYYLGLDSSTQSLTAIIIDLEHGQIVAQESVNYGQDLPEFGCPYGFLPNENPLIRHSNPLLWVAALDLLFQKGRAAGIKWEKVSGICGSGQQHGSVYLNGQFLTDWQLDPQRSLVDQIQPLLARKTSPIWMDSSTSTECEEIAQEMGGTDIVCRISGSIPIERFTGPQIRKFYKENPEDYEKTARIHLVSSFMASILIGHDAMIDTGDAAGMNLMDLKTYDWDADLLAATAPDLRRRLPKIVQGCVPVGEIHGYFVKKYGFRAGTPVYVWSGDNPCSLVGMGAIEPGIAVISLGTSDTFFAAMRQPQTDPNGFGHVFGNPAGGFMSLICFKNGSLVREFVAQKCGMNWKEFEHALLAESEPGNHNNLVFPFREAEITPKILNPSFRLVGDHLFENYQKKAELVRGTVEAQIMNMKIHSSWISDAPTRIRVTGGASRDRGIVQIIADIFQAPVEQFQVGKSAALGAALMAARGHTHKPWKELLTKFCSSSSNLVQPNPQVASIYHELMQKWLEYLKKFYLI